MYFLHMGNLLCILKLTTINMAVKWTTSIKLIRFYSELYCDAINIYQTLNFVGCSSQCLFVADFCEGISFMKLSSLKKYTCKVCLVKEVRSRMKRFTLPTNNTRVYRRLIDLEKGITFIYVKLQTILNTPKLLLMKFINKFEPFLNFENISP